MYSLLSDDLGSVSRSGPLDQDVEDDDVFVVLVKTACHISQLLLRREPRLRNNPYNPITPITPGEGK